MGLGPARGGDDKAVACWEEGARRRRQFLSAAAAASGDLHLLLATPPPPPPPPRSSSPPSAGKQDLTLRPLQIVACGLLPMVCAGMDPRSGDWGLDFIPLVCASGRASLGHAAAMLALGRDLGMARLVSYLGVPFLLHPFLCSVKFVYALEDLSSLFLSSII
ncbi:hypothetical protein PVAP13_5KG030740 [Panicum virgatum]|uniref:Uncharacterized protein n=1 Tax=Panicum virgatum TaxID=38727 RepID=A0A8T0S9M0_PANVG|nr:hypothetical protein PVAP13_5KG030740 [Panicum virgatum]